MKRKSVLFIPYFWLIFLLHFSVSAQIQTVNEQAPTTEPIKWESSTGQINFVYATPTGLTGAIQIENEPQALSTPLPIQKQVAESSASCVAVMNGSSCTMALEVASEPAYRAGVSLYQGEVFYKSWQVRNTGSCTWTKDYRFVFKSGNQIGSTSFAIPQETAPGDTVLITLGMTAALPVGHDYFSAYTLQNPDGTTCGEIVSYFRVKYWNELDAMKTQTPIPWSPYAPCVGSYGCSNSNYYAPINYWP